MHYSALMKDDGAGGAVVVVEPTSADCVTASSMATADSKNIIAADAAAKALEHRQMAMIVMMAEHDSVRLAAALPSQGVFASLSSSRSGGIYDVKNARFARFLRQHER
jgi:hypothetical protein